MAQGRGGRCVGTTPEKDGLILTSGPKTDVRRRSTPVVTRCTQECRGRHVSVRLGMRPSEKDTSTLITESQESANWDAKEFKSDARPELHAPHTAFVGT